jgi:mannose-6-phosphate isomerase-like protein (cupin superfamily)
MKKGTRISLTEQISSLRYLSNRTPEMSLTGGAERAFAELAAYRDGALYVGHYSGNSEWERHARGDEVVLALAGHTTLILLEDGDERRVELSANELAVVPANTWHRFENSRQLAVVTVTPQPTDHSVQRPDR